MKLIKISNTVAVNPDSIDAIEVGKGANRRMTIVHVNGKSYSTELPARQLLTAIELSTENKFDGFFAG
jgi:hypothetical protein